MFYQLKWDRNRVLIQVWFKSVSTFDNFALHRCTSGVCVWELRGNFQLGVARLSSHVLCMRPDRKVPLRSYPPVLTCIMCMSSERKIPVRNLLAVLTCVKCMRSERNVPVSWLPPVCHVRSEKIIPVRSHQAALTCVMYVRSEKKIPVRSQLAGLMHVMWSLRGMFQLGVTQLPSRMSCLGGLREMF